HSLTLACLLPFFLYCHVSPFFFFYSFFFYCYAHHRDLHSFPTRRSSDLPAGSTARPCESPTASRARRRWASSSPSSSAGNYRTRSEEHTSELQSLAYLVCRLLLEKKKKNKNRLK